MSAAPAAAPAEAPPPPARFRVEAVLFSTYAAFGLSWIAVTPLLGELQKEFGVSSAGLGLLNTTVSIAKVIAPLLTGALAVRLGLARTILLGSLLVALAALAAAAAPGFGWFVAARFAFGVGGAVIVTLLGPMVMQWFPRGELPLVNAFNNVAVNTGIALTLFTTVPLAARLGWRGALFFYAGINGLLFALGLLVVRERAAAPVAAGAAPGKEAEGGVLDRYLEVWRMKETWLVTVAFTAPLALYLAFNTWLPRHYIEALHFSKAAASRFAGLINLVGIPAAIAGGVLTRKLGVRRPFLLGAGAVIGFAAFGMFLLAEPWQLLACAVVLGTCFFLGGSPLFTLAMELRGMTPARVSLMMGTVFSAAYVVASAAPVLVGWLRDRTGSFVPGLSLWAAGSFALLVAGALLPETGPGPAAAPAVPLDTPDPAGADRRPRST